MAQSFRIVWSRGQGIPGVGGFQHRPLNGAVFDQRNAGEDRTGDFQAGAAQFAAAHDGVQVAHLNQTALDPYREVGGVALDHKLTVQVAAMAAGETAGHAVALLGSHADNADHGIDGESDIVEAGFAVLIRDAFGAGFTFVPEGTDFRQSRGGAHGVALNV